MWLIAIDNSGDVGNKGNKVFDKFYETHIVYHECDTFSEKKMLVGEEKISIYKLSDKNTIRTTSAEFV